MWMNTIILFYWYDLLQIAEIIFQHRQFALIMIVEPNIDASSASVDIIKRAVSVYSRN